MSDFHDAWTKSPTRAGTERNLRRHDRYYDGQEPNRIAWCAYYRTQLIEHGVVIPQSPIDGQSIVDDVLAMVRAMDENVALNSGYYRLER